MQTMPTKPTTALEQLAELQAEFDKKAQAIREEARGELVLKIKKNREEFAELQAQYEQLTGKPAKHTFGGNEGPHGKSSERKRITIDQIKDAIKNGSKNNATIAAHLGCSKANVAAKVKKDGKAAGIKHKGERVNFEYFL